jgi:hypothetical protein
MHYPSFGNSRFRVRFTSLHPAPGVHLRVQFLSTWMTLFGAALCVLFHPPYCDGSKKFYGTFCFVLMY